MNAAAYIQHSQTLRADTPLGQIFALLCWIAVAVLSQAAWRRRRRRNAADPLIVSGFWLAARVVLLVVDLVSPGRADGWLNAALDLTGLVLLAWPFLAPPLAARWADRLAGAGLSLAALACGIALWQWVRDALGLPPIQPQLVITWAHSLLTLTGLAALNLLRRPPHRLYWILLAAGALLVGAYGIAVSSPPSHWATSALAAIVAALAAFALDRLERSSHPAAQIAPAEAAAPGPWRPSQWLEASTALFVAPDLPQLLKAATAALAYIVDVHLTGLILAEDEPPLRLRLVARCPQTSGLGLDAPFTPDFCPLLADTLARGQIARVDREADPAQVEPLDRILGTVVRAALLLPLVGDPDVHGVLTLVRDSAVLDAGQIHLCGKLADQVTVAVSHVRMRAKIVAQAQSLAHLVRRHKQELDRLIAILESIADGVVVSDAEDKIILVNRAALDILHKRREEIIGRPFGQIVNRTIRVGDVNAIGVVTEDLPYSMEAVFEVAGRAVQTSMAPVKANGGAQLGVVALLRDVTARVRTETRREQELDNLREQNRQLAEAAEHLRELVWTGDIELNLSRVDLQGLIEDVVGRVAAQVGNKPVTIVRALEFGLPAVRADKARIRQVLLNLLGNAIRYTREGQIAVSASRGKDYVIASVAHIGAGVSSQYVDAVYEEFGRSNGGLSRTVDGLRLGLSVSRRLIELHGGKTWVRKGQVVIIYLGLPIDGPHS